MALLCALSFNFSLSLSTIGIWDHILYSNFKFSLSLSTEGVGIISCILNSNVHFHFLQERVGIISCLLNSNFHFHFLQEGVGIMETPNYPLPFPASASCRWRVSPGHTRRVGLYLQTICFIKKSNDIKARYPLVNNFTS